MAVKAHGLVQKIKKEKSQKSKCQAAIVKIVSLMPRVDPRQDSRNHEPQHQGKTGSQQQAGDRQMHLPHDKAPLGVTEKKLADKRAKAGGKHTYVQILFKVQPVPFQIKERRQKAGPQIEKIQPVKAVCHHQEIPGHGIGPGLSPKSCHKEKADHAAGPCVEHGAGKASQGKIIRDQRAGRDHNPVPVHKDMAPFPGIVSRSPGRKKARQGEAQGNAVDDPAVGVCLCFHNIPPLCKTEVYRFRFTGGIFLSGYAGQEASGVGPMWKTGQKQSYKPA